MTLKTIYLITGANRGIGLALTATLLLRPNTTIIATVRSISTDKDNLFSLPIVDNSNIIIELLSTDGKHPADVLINTLVTTHNIKHIDNLISNIGVSSFSSILATTATTLIQTLETNTLLPIALFQSSYPLLSKSANPKFILVSSLLGSIGEMDESPSLAYGISKAAANYFVRKVHFEFKDVVAFALHPGWVKTENGQKFADAVGVPKPPMTTSEVTEKLLVQIDTATKTATSGEFIKFDGTVIPW